LWPSRPSLGRQRGPPAQDQDTSPPSGSAKVYGLDLKSNPATPFGKAAGAGGTVGAAGHRFEIGQLTITQPVVVAAIAENPALPIEVRLAKYNFDAVERDGRTDGGGQVAFKFRTEGDLLILVRAATAEPSPYSLVVWVGDEVTRDAGPPFVPMRKRSGARGFWLNLPFAAGVGGGLAVAGIAVLLARRRRHGAVRHSGVALLVVSIVSTPAAAQFIEENIRELAGDALSAAANRAGVGTMIGQIITFGDAAATFLTMKPLSPFDGSVDSPPPGAPELPSNCLESAACAACFAPANARLTLVLTTLEKLRRKGAWTRTYKDRALAFGASIASFPGAGLGWAGARAEIEGGYLKFQAAYDAKYQELIASLKSSLQDISQCEESIYQEHDWYNRFGFIYYQFMAERYRRTD
jgi:hypothetical protein